MVDGNDEQNDTQPAATDEGRAERRRRLLDSAGGPDLADDEIMAGAWHTGVYHPNGLRYGVVRRQPAPGFAHAILLDQGGHKETWLCVDLYGDLELLADTDVADWPIVYTPALAAEWPVTDDR